MMVVVVGRMMWRNANASRKVLFFMSLTKSIEYLCRFENLKIPTYRVYFQNKISRRNILYLSLLLKYK